MRATKKRPRCASCGRRIREHQSDLILEDVAGGKRRYYHAGCCAAAYALATERPSAYLLTVRHVEDAARN